MTSLPILSCCVIYGFETLDAAAAADLLELILKIPISKNDAAESNGKLYGYHASLVKIGELESVLLFDNRVGENSWREPLFPESWFVADIVWKTTNLLEPGRLAAAIEACGDVRIKLIRYEVTGDWIGNGSQQTIRREFRPVDEELKWDSHFSQYYG